MNSRITDLLSVVHSVAKVASKIADSQTQRISRSLPSLSNTIPTLNNTSSFGDDSLLRDIQKFNQNDTIDSSRPRNVVEAMEDKNSPNMLYLNDGPTEEQTQISELHDSGQLKLNSGAADAGGKPATGANAFKIDEDVKQSLAVQTDLAQLDELNRKRSETVTNSRCYTPTTSTAPPEPSYPRPLIDSSIPSPANTAKLFNEESITKSPPIEDSGGKPLSSSTVPILEDSTSSSANHEDQIPSEGTQAPKQLKEARVSTTRIGRLFQYGGLVARLGVGAVGEAVRRATGQSKPLIEGASPLLSEANIERIVAKLSEMRGAALKLGQIISIQDSNVMPKQIEELLSKVQNSANYMPKRQMLGVMKSELGPDWQSNFHSFDETPFAAASIGQVHSAIISEKFASYPPNFRVAVKLQYPGIANSIDSDLNNLKSFALFSGLLPKGMYLESAIQVARRELHWETDYKREAECMNRFRNLLLTGKQELDETTQLEFKKMEMEGDFVVPRVVDELSTGEVLTTEFVEGVTMGKVADMSQPVRDSVAIRVLRLCLRELFEFRFMQTDPNYANFLYEAKTNQIKLLDFGSTRSFSQSFTDKYIKVLEGAVKRDEQAVLDYSRQLGFLTGFETESMNQAHLTAVLTLAEPFRHRIYDFSSASSITSKVRSLIPTMLEHRLTPPPDETYSLHRKLSGVFLLCAKLRCKIGCERVWWEEWERYENRKRELNNQNVS